MRALFWFRADLRIEDNPALSAASRAADDGVLAVFTVCPKQWLDLHDLSEAKVDLMLRTLESLSISLDKLNIPLVFIEEPTFSTVPEALLKLAKRHKVEVLYFNREHEVNEVARDEAVTDLFESSGLEVHSFLDQTVIEPDSIRTGQGGFYSVYSPFKRAWYAAFNEDRARDYAPKPKKQTEMVCKPGRVPAKVRGFARRENLNDLWPAGEREAVKRLKNFCENKIDSYKEDRDFPDLDATSCLSPYLAVGAISPFQCIRAGLDANDGKLEKGSKGAVHWISEVLWREFYRHIIVGYPRVCRHQPFKLDTRAIEWKDNDEHFEAWCEGRTGVPIVDAAMRQMLQTGWMHNRLRMVAAMFLSKDLFLDWRQGEKYFMRHLIDGDLANNNGGWQWSASTGVDAAPYFRIFNPYSQSSRFDPDGDFIRSYVPELADLPADEIHDPSKIPGLLRSQIDYPEPIVEHSKAREHAIEAFKKIK